MNIYASRTRSRLAALTHPTVRLKVVHRLAVLIV
jgi:hypothetical protein